VRITKNVQTRLSASTSECAKAAQFIPPSLLQLLIAKNLSEVLNQESLTLFKTVLAVMQYLILIVITQIFLFVAFQVQREKESEESEERERERERERGREGATQTASLSKTKQCKQTFLSSPTVLTLS
jgi:flagellar biosynthesis/type III secretory pathway M-ring protein FliF/YscJ